MVVDKKILIPITEGLAGPFFAGLFIALTSLLDNQGEAGLALLGFSVYSFLLLGFFLGVSKFKRKYLFLGMLPFVLWFLGIRFVLTGPNMFSQLAIGAYINAIGFLLFFSLIGWVVGFLLRLTWDQIVNPFLSRRKQANPMN